MVAHDCEEVLSVPLEPIIESSCPPLWECFESNPFHRRFVKQVEFSFWALTSTGDQTIWRHYERIGLEWKLGSPVVLVFFSFTISHSSKLGRHLVPPIHCIPISRPQSFGFEKPGSRPRKILIIKFL